MSFEILSMKANTYKVSGKEVKIHIHNDHY